MWGLIELLALQGEKVEEELVQTKDRAKGEEAKLNAEITSLRVQCSEVCYI